MGHPVCNDVKHQVITNIQTPMSAIQMDESTDVGNLSQLMFFAPVTKVKCLFLEPLETTTKAEDTMAVVSTFFEEMNLNWKN